MPFKITLENIGPITKANLELGQITVIVGENNVGKSFVLKSVYSVFKAFEMERILLEEEIYKALVSAKVALLRRRGLELSEDIEKERDQILKEINLYLKSDLSIRDLSRVVEILDRTIDLLKNIDKYIENTEKIAIHINKKIKRKIIIPTKDFLQHISSKEKEKLMKLKFDLQLLKKSEYRLKKAWKILIKDVFLNKIVKVGTKLGKIIIKDVATFKFNGDVEIEFGDVWYSGILKPVFVESPILLELKPYLAKTTEKKIGLSRELPIHIGSLFEYVETISETEDNEILEDLRNIIYGDIYHNIEDGKFYYKSEYYNKSFDMLNVASGVKSFGILQLLIKSGACENTIFFWEEPESHLHPEWQIKFAEIVAKIVKRNNYFVISTHSPFMVEILRVVSKENEIDAKFYYMDKNSELIEVNDENWEIISDSLLRPLRKIAYRLFRVS